MKPQIFFLLMTVVYIFHKFRKVLISKGTLIFVSVSNSFPKAQCYLTS